MLTLPFAVASACTRQTPQPSSGAPAAGSQLPSSIVDPYLKIQTALAQDRMDDVKPNADAIKTAAGGLGASAKEIDAAAGQLASSTQIGEARQKFGTLNDAIFAYMKGAHMAAPADIRTAYCPMAQKSWLQRGDTIANPYYGTSMPTCGTFQ
jgi:membrane fusion protein, copper/silver efflux system